MNKLWKLLIACILLGAMPIDAAQTDNVVVGVNIYDLGLTQASQDGWIQRLAENGVKTIRTSLSDKTVYFITQAYRHGIGSIVIIYPTWGSKAKHKLRWSDAPLTAADPQGLAAWFKPLLNQLEAAEVRLTALEFGNEINTSGYNSDIPMPGTGRVLGLADLNNPNDPEGPAIANGYRRYLRVLEALKEVRDHSKLNQTTPILSGASGDWGLPSPQSWSKVAGVSVPDSVEFLRQNGLDKLVDGYAVHVYPSGDLNRSVSQRVDSLEKYVFGMCKKDTKPCWLTEWGFSNSSQTCPIDDSTRLKVIKVQRSAFQQFVRQGRLAAIIYYTWTGPATKLDPMAIFRCGALTDAGKAALSPM